jgi:tetratricopeptide (TPR) repeat protein
VEWSPRHTKSLNPYGPGATETRKPSKSSPPSSTRSCTGQRTPIWPRSAWATLETTALVNEVYLRLVDIREVTWQDRGHFFSDPRDTDALSYLALYEAKSGDLEKARLSIHQAVGLAPKDVTVPSMAAEVYAVTGDQQKALECLKSAVQGGYPRFEIERNPELDGLRNDPRYREIMAAAPKPHGRRIRTLGRSQTPDRDPIATLHG